MDVCRGYQVINRIILDVAMSINKLTPIKNEPEEIYKRLEESNYSISMETKRFCKVVTAHNLSQYVNRFYDIRLEENIENWLDDLINVDKETR